MTSTTTTTMNSSLHQSLSVPLIGTLPHEADDVECQQQLQEEHCCSETRTRKAQTNEEDTTFDRFLTFLQPFLLIVQFVSALAFERENNKLGLDFNQVFGSIMVFALISLIFQRTVRFEKIRCLLVILIPDICTALVCCLVYYHRTSQAFVTLVASTMLMALCIVVASVHLLWTDKVEEEEGEEKIRNDKDTAILILCSLLLLYLLFT